MRPKPNTVSLDTLAESLPPIFDQVQTSVSNHRKNSVALHKIHSRASVVGDTTGDGSRRLTGEHRFTTVFLEMLSRVLPCKKGVQPADRVVKFVAAYVSYISEKGLPSFGVEESEEEDEPDTPVSRFITRLNNFVLKGFLAKDKNIRLRSVNVVSELIAHLGELDEDLYIQLRDALLERTRDKEPAIRAQAVVALARLVSGDDDADNTLDTMLDCLCCDPAPEVRRLALVNIPVTPATLPAILTRTRDEDAVVRGLLYGSVLSRPNSNRDRHVLRPSQLSIAQRERLVRDGLGDRKDPVRATAASMLVGWFDLVSDSDKESIFLQSSLSFLKLFDIVAPEGELIAADALRTVFLSKPQELRKFAFPDTYWSALTPESALFARCFIEYTSPITGDASCSGIGMTSANMVENAAVPVVTAFAFYVQEACNSMLSTMEELETIKETQDDELEGGGDENEADVARCEADLVDKVFMLSEMLKIAHCLDYQDEIGRRKMFMVIRSIVAHEYLPESLIEACLGVLEQSATDEREMIRVTVEVIAELRDFVADDEVLDQDDRSAVLSGLDRTDDSAPPSRLVNRSATMRELTAQEQQRADQMDLRCLLITIALLKRANGKFDDNSTLQGVVTDLIIPAVKRCEAEHRELGMMALGLCCLIAKHMALQSFPLFCNQAQNAPEPLKAKVFQIIFDLLLVHAEGFFGTTKGMSEQILAFLLQTFENDDSHSVRAVICIGLSKLVLNGLVQDERVLATLVLAFVSPANTGNQELLQCLAYFVEAYSYSSHANQAHMQSIFLTVIDLVVQAHNELEEDQKMISPAQFCSLFIDWTDPRKRSPGSLSSAGTGTEDTHLDLALDVLKTLYDADQGRLHKHIAPALAKLHLPSTPDHGRLLCLRILLEHQNMYCPDELAVRKAVEKFSAKVDKLYATTKINAAAYETDPRYVLVRDLMHGGVATGDDGEEESSDNEDQPQLITPMKPPTRRKQRTPSPEVSEQSDEEVAAVNATPASRSPPSSPTPSASSLPSPLVDRPARGLAQPLPFKARKKRKVTPKHTKASSSRVVRRSADVSSEDDSDS